MFEIVLKVTRMQGKHSINGATSLAYAMDTMLCHFPLHNKYKTYT